MKWRLLLGLSLVTSHPMMVGCTGSRSGLVNDHADLPALMGDTVETSAVTRGQKPENDPGPRRDDNTKPAPAKPAENPLTLTEIPVSTAGSRAARIRATVNGEAILDEEVLASAYQGLFAVRSDAERVALLNDHLNQIIDREVVLQDAFVKLADKGGGKFITQLQKAASQAFDKEWLQKMMKNNNYTDEKLFRKFMRDNHMPLDLIRRQWERNFIAMEYMRHRTEPAMTKIGHLQIMEYYKSHPEDFKVEDSVQWQDLFIASAGYPSKEAAREFAEALAGRIRKGEDFVKLAKEFDKGVASLRENAEGIGHKHGEIRPAEAEAVLFGLKDGEVGPLVEIHTGFHIVRVIKRQRAGQLPFNETVQRQVRDRLKNEVFTKEMKRIVADLKRKAIIVIARDP
jgi:parvulin-like peptidyl-prolyl isomerase